MKWPALHIGIVLPEVYFSDFDTSQLVCFAKYLHGIFFHIISFNLLFIVFRFLKQNKTYLIAWFLNSSWLELMEVLCFWLGKVTETVIESGHHSYGGVYIGHAFLAHMTLTDIYSLFILNKYLKCGPEVIRLWSCKVCFHHIHLEFYHPKTKNLDWVSRYLGIKGKRLWRRCHHTFFAHGI